MDSIWEVATKKFDDVIDQLLYNRSILNKRVGSKEARKNFIDPDFDKDLYDPFLMSGIDKAVKRIELAIENNEKVGIFADYDADGIPGGALLYRGLKQIGVKPEIFIPNRELGYGLSSEGIDFLISKKCTLVITVDLGIRNFSEAIYCMEKKIDLIITDHHLPDTKIPEAFCVINPKITGDRYPFKELSGGGVVFKLLQALSTKFDQIDQKFLKWNLDLVAISTITDVVPLIDENRIFAKFGLKVLSKTRNTGLASLCKISKILIDSMNTYDVGFKIGPRINAPGRLDHATKSFELLVTEDVNEANFLANWLDEKNEERQVIMERTEKEATQQIIESKLYDLNIIVVAGKWIKGVIGPTASRLVEKFNRPTILFAEENDEFCGSARSVSGVNILEIIDSSKEFIKRYGGHKGAAGLTVLSSDFSDFLKKINLNAKKNINPKDLIKKIKIDLEIKFEDLSISLYENIAKLDPFGMGNPKPKFVIRGIEVESLKPVGLKKNHLSFNVKSKDKSIKSIYFNYDKDKELVSHDLYDIVFTLEINEWQNKRDLNLQVIDMKPHTL